MSGPKVYTPSWLLMTPRDPKDPSGYTHSTATDIRIRFAAVLAQQAPASTKNVTVINKQRKASK